MSDDDKTKADSAVKPQVIDLAAEDVTEVETPPPPPDDTPGEVPPAAPPPSPRRRARSGAYLGLAALLLAGALAGGWLYRDVLSSYFPSNAVTELGSRMAALETNHKTLQEQLAALGATSQQSSAAQAQLDQAVKDLTGAYNGTAEQFAKLEQRIAASERALAAARSDLDVLRNAISANGTGSGGSADAAALAALGQRIDALEKDVASLKTAATPAGDANAASVLSQSLADLKAKVAGGNAYQAEYDRIARMVPAAPGLDVLAAHAALGLPTAQGLAKELRDLIPALPASPAGEVSPSEPSYWDQIWSALTSVVTIRDVGATDWRMIAEQAAGLAEGGDLAGATATIDAAEGGKPAGLSQWRDRAAARIALEQAVEQAAGAVLRQITALGGAP